MTVDHFRRRLSAAGAAVLGGAAAWPSAQADESQDSAGSNVLRILFESAETGFDPAQVTDLYSQRVCAHIFEALLGYDPVAVPVRLVPATAEAMPEASADFRVWTVRLKKGVLFADDPAFKGQPREHVASDVVYSFKRIFDPATKSPSYSSLNEEGIVGLDDLRQRALKSKASFDYASDIPGLRALDRYTVQFTLASGRPRFATTLASTYYASLAREVVETYAADIMGHPVGTGPYRLKTWRRSSRIVLEKNPSYRDQRYDARPAPDDAEGQAWARKFNGRKLPLNDGVEISVVLEAQPQWLAFLNGQFDFCRIRPELALIGAPGGKIAPNIAKRGVRLQRYLNSDVAYSYFNMEDAVVGGYAPAQVALRRAISLAYNIDYEIRIIRRGNAIAAQAPLAPHVFGYDPQFRTENSTYDPARANALLDTYGYLDRDGDGWRERPDGSPLSIVMATEGTQSDRQYNENWRKSMGAIGVRMNFEVAQWAEHLKGARAGKLQMWFLGGTATQPDGQGDLETMYGEASGEANLARFRNADFDAIYRRMQGMADGPERAELFKRASEIVVAYMPYRIHCHRIYNDFTWPWIEGYRQPFFRNQSWHYIAVDAAQRAKALA